ncbi:MAG: endolytic transglycosylase MltG [Candidatus Sumerlaeaceae bacterium]
MQTKDTGDQEPKGASVVPTEQAPESSARPAHFLEIVWSSPAFTTPAPPLAGEGAGTKIPRASTRYVHAFESDFLDSHVSWDEEKQDAPAEAMPKRKPRRAAPRTAGSNVRLLDIYPADMQNPRPQQAELAFPGDITVAPAALSPAAEQPAAESFPTHRFQQSVEQPMVGGRPTGMVFFETMAQRPSLPGRVVYSTNEPIIEPELAVEQVEEAPVEAAEAVPPEPEAAAPATPIRTVVPPPDLQAIIARARPEAAAVASAVRPFFDIPEHIPPVPSEDTADLYHKPAGQRTYGHRFLNALSWCVLIGFFLTVAVGLLYGRYAHKRLYRGDTGSGRVVDLVVQPGETFRVVLTKMKKQGLLGSYLGLSDYYLMRYLAHLNENSNKIKPGAYRINSNSSLSEVYNRLIEGSKDFKITIPEGKTVREVATEVKRRYAEFDDVRFMELVKDADLIKKLGMEVPSLEGYLYPSTYFFGPGMKEEDLIRLMVNTFKQNVETQVKPLGKHDQLSLHEHVIMASLIEREARMDEDRPLIASVIFNRLGKDMPLQIDATVNYALNDWRKLSLDDLKVNSPYNTYLRKGLPPGPIASPRIASLVATYTAPQTDYLYYVYQGDGRHAFSATYEEFLGNKHKFQRGGVEAANFAAVATETTKTVPAGTPAAAAKRSRK